MLAIVYAIFSLVTAFIIGYDKIQLHLLFFLIFNQFLISFTLYLRSNISGLHLFRTDSILSVFDRSLMIAICSLLLFTGYFRKHFSIEWFVYAQTAAYVITSLVTFVIVLNKTGKIRLRFDRKFIIVFLRKSYPYAILILLMGFYNRIDGVMLERLLPEPLGKQQAGIYAQAFRLLDAANMIAYLFAVLLLPLFARMIKLKLSVENLVKTSFSLLFAISVVVALGSYFYSTEWMNWLYPKHMDESLNEFNTRITESAKVFSLLMFGFIAISTTYVFGTLLTANGSLKKLNIVAGTGVIISLSINLLLVPRLMAVGSAYASLCAQFITAIAQLIIAVKIFKFRMNYKYLGILLAFLSGLILAGYFSKLLPYDWKINFSVMLVVSILLTFVLRLINIKELIRVLRSEQA